MDEMTGEHRAEPRKPGRVTCSGWVLVLVVFVALLWMLGMAQAENRALRYRVTELEAQLAARGGAIAPPEPAEGGQAAFVGQEAAFATSQTVLEAPAASPLAVETVESVAEAASATAPPPTPTTMPTEPPPTPTITPTATPAPPAPTPVLMRGSGQQASPNFAAAGAVVTDFLHEGSGHFGVVMKDAATAANVDLVANDIGAVRGSKLSAPAAGEYFYEVQADGPWALRTQPLATWPRVGAAPQRFEGSGPTASGVFSLRGGRVDFALAHQGEGFFGVTLHEAGSGALVDLLANEIGAASVTKAAGVVDGEYLLQVDADGAWSVDVTQ